MLKIFVRYAVSGSKADVNLHTVIKAFLDLESVLMQPFCVFLQLQETMVQGAVEEVVDMEEGAVTEFLQACHG